MSSDSCEYKTIPFSAWLYTKIRSPWPGLKPVKWCRLYLGRFGREKCRMLVLLMPVDSRSSIPTIDARDVFMAGCVTGGKSCSSTREELVKLVAMRFLKFGFT